MGTEANLLYLDYKGGRLIIVNTASLLVYIFQIPSCFATIVSARYLSCSSVLSSFYLFQFSPLCMICYFNY